jgi:nucleotide-binding universal stress UspA family protein
MPESLFRSVLVPIASETDAEATCAALEQYLPADSRVEVVHVIEKAGGAPDKASVEQREERAERIFDTVAAYFDGDVDVETDVLYGTDVAETILDHAADTDAAAIAFTPRGASRWMKLLSGDVASALTQKADRPVLVLPAPDGQTDGGRPDAPADEPKSGRDG